MNAALHSFLKQTINASNVTHDARPPTIMASPDNHLTTIPSFYSQTILVSNLYIGAANHPFQLGDMTKMAKNLKIELDITDLMLKFDSGVSQQHTNLLFRFQDSHAVTLKLRTPIQVSDRYDPEKNTFPPDWYISDHGKKKKKRLLTFEKVKNYSKSQFSSNSRSKCNFPLY
jgi:hypothetical protein